MREELRNRERSFRPLRPKLVRHLLPGGNGFGVALAGLLPPGFFPTTFLQRFPGMENHTDWPNGLWVPAVRADDGTVVVFGRDRTDVAVAEAVEASSAVPGMFRPYLFDGVPYVDGGLASPTHADLAAGIDPDLVIISAPMAKPVLRPMAGLARARLRTETARLRATGLDPVVITPTRDLVEQAQGYPRRNPDAAPIIEATAAELTARALTAAGLVGTG
jgi:NTE family protein